MDGINIQYLNGVDAMPIASIVPNYYSPAIAHIADKQVDRTVLSGFLQNGTHSAYRLFKQSADVDAVVNGFDFDGMTAVNSTDDQEKVRNYIERTKDVVDKSPELIQGYRNPQTFSEMLGYILRYWDSSSREEAIHRMAKKEAKLLRNGQITKVDEGAGSDEYAGAFFAALAKLMLPQNDIAKAAAPLLADEKDKVRAAHKRARRWTVGRHGEKKSVVNANQVGALCGIDEVETAGGMVDYVFNGFDGIPTDMINGLGYAGVEAYDHNQGYLTALSGFFKNIIKKRQNATKKIVRVAAKKPLEYCTCPTTDATKTVSGLYGVDAIEVEQYGGYYGYDGFFSKLKKSVKTANAAQPKANEEMVARLKKKAKARQKRVICKTCGKVKLSTIQRAVNGIDDTLAVWNNPMMRDQVMDYNIATSADDGALHGFFKKLKKAIKKVGSAVKKVTKSVVKVATAPVKAVAKATKAAVKFTVNTVKDPKSILKNAKSLVKDTVKATVVDPTKTVVKETANIVKHTIIEPTKAVVKVLKKVVKFIIRYNPISLGIRALLLMAARHNWFKITERCYPGTLASKEQAVSQCGILPENWDKHKKAYSKFWSVFKKFGGYESELKKALDKGKKKAWNGSDDPSAVTKSVVEAEAKKDQQGFDSDVATAEKALKSKNAELQVVTNKGDDYYEEVKATSTVVENRVKANKAATFLSDPNNANSSQGTIAKDIIVPYDQSYNDNTYYRVEYNGKNGYVVKTAFDKVKIDGNPTTTTAKSSVKGLGDAATLIGAIVGGVAALAGIVISIKNLKFQSQQAKEQKQQVEQARKDAEKLAQENAEAERAFQQEQLELQRQQQEAAAQAAQAALLKPLSASTPPPTTSTASFGKWGMIALLGVGAAMLLMPKKKKQTNDTTNPNN